MTSLTPARLARAIVTAIPAYLNLLRPEAAGRARQSAAESQRTHLPGPNLRPQCCIDLQRGRCRPRHAREIMETRRLRAIQNPSRTLALLESYAASHELLTCAAYRITRVSELTAPLRRLVCELEVDSWCAWADAGQIWLFCATASLELSRERRKPVLQIRLYGQRGQLVEASTCVFTSDRGWQRCL